MHLFKVISDIHRIYQFNLSPRARTLFLSRRPLIFLSDSKITCIPHVRAATSSTFEWAIGIQFLIRMFDEALRMTASFRRTHKFHFGDPEQPNKYCVYGFTHTDLVRPKWHGTAKKPRPFSFRCA